MINIRKGLFETNSSSSNSLVLCGNDTWNKFLKHELFYNVLSETNGYPQFCTFKQVKDYIKNKITNVTLPENWRDMTEESLREYEEFERHHQLLFFPETFYSIDELESYNYNSDTKEAHLTYYFG